MEVDRPSFLQGLHRASQKADCRSSHSRNSRRVFRLPRLFNKDASASHFVNPKINSAQTNPRGKSKEGGRSPLLGRFKGVCKGGKSKSPLCWFPFHRQRPFPLSSKEKGAEYHSYGTTPSLFFLFSLSRRKKPDSSADASSSSTPETISGFWLHGSINRSTAEPQQPLTVSFAP